MFKILKLGVPNCLFFSYGMLYIWKVTWDNWDGYDCYDSFVIIAKTEDEARRTRPDGHLPGEWTEEKEERYFRGWIPFAKRNELRVEKIGRALKKQEPGILLASYNAG